MLGCTCAFDEKWPSGLRSTFSDSEKTQKGNVWWPYRTLVLCMFLAFNSGESPSITKREATQSKSIFQVRQQHSNRHNDADTRQDIATSGIILHENCCHWSVARWSIQMCFDDSVCLFVKCCIRWHGGIYHRYRFVYHRPLCSNSCPSAPSWLFTTRIIVFLFELCLHSSGQVLVTSPRMAAAVIERCVRVLAFRILILWKPLKDKKAQKGI